MGNIILLIAALNVCHWIGDFTHASRPWMLAAKRFGKPVGPIAVHAVVHALLMAIVCLVLVNEQAGVLAFAIQFPTHLAIDILKGRLNGWFPALQDPTKYPHWYVFGADQLAHQLVIMIITVLVL